jgi:hypothetical protein
MDLPNNIHIQAIAKILESAGEHVEGNLICDITPYNYLIHKNFAKIKNLQHVCKNKRKICEIGVNACHSLLLMIMVNPGAEYVLFDLNTHKYTDLCIQYIMNAFPSTKISVYYGNSVETVKKYMETNIMDIASFDMCNIDGGHTHNVFSHDYVHVNKLLSTDGIVVFNNYDYGDIKTFLDEKVSCNEIIQVLDNRLIATNGHFIYKLV